MDTYPQKDGFQNCVFNVYWRVNAFDNQLQSSLFGQQPVVLDAVEQYTPYDKLTQDQVIGWVKTAMGQGQVAQIEGRLLSLIQNQIKPQVTTPPLPW